MLQQTTVAAVIPYFERFTSRWPTVEALAASDDAEVMSAWAGLGYYARARNLLACARVVAGECGGRFPRTEAGLLELPGVGAYTAAAIASIAFGKRAVVVDGNVERVIARVFAVDAPLPAAKPVIRARADELTPAERPGDYAQAVMDLGATICTPRNPACSRCPWTTICRAFAKGAQERYPVKAAKAARPTRYGVAYWIKVADHVLLVRRPAKGLLGGMRALPTSGWHAARVAPAAEEPISTDWHLAPAPVRHGFTHFELVLDVAKAELPERPLIGGDWVPTGALDQAGLPTLFRRCVEAATAPLLL
jgi:A/G-specific adenine glycosylase